MVRADPSTRWSSADLPFGSYEEGPTQALRTAVRFMKEGGATRSSWRAAGAAPPQIAAITGAGIPVMAHIGFTPQSEHTLGGYRVQGRGDAADEVLADAHAVAEAGAFAVVLEMVPGEVAKQVTAGAADPHDRHRRRPRQRRPGAGLAGHGRAAHRQGAAVRQAVRRPGRRADRGDPRSSPTRSAAASSPPPSTRSEPGWAVAAPSFPREPPPPTGPLPGLPHPGPPGQVSRLPPRNG